MRSLTSDGLSREVQASAKRGQVQLRLGLGFRALHTHNRVAGVQPAQQLHGPAVAVRARNHLRR